MRSNYLKATLKTAVRRYQLFSSSERAWPSPSSRST